MSRSAVAMVVVLALGASVARADDYDDTLRFAVPRPVIPRFEREAAPPPPPPPPDTAAYLHWPLGTTRHPSLEPAFRIAAALAAPGVSWLQLCERGAQYRRSTKDSELTEYLGAWCEIAKRDSKSALVRLAALLRSVNPKLRDAIRFDVASIAVDMGGAKAESAIAEAKLGAIEIYDMVSAAFVDFDDTSSATLFNELALGADAGNNQADRCRRLARRFLLGPIDEQRKNLAAFGNPVDATCARLVTELACAHLGQCAKPAKSPPDRLVVSYKYWPTWETNSWHDVAREFYAWRDEPDVDRLLVPAIEAAIKGRRCDHFVVTEMREKAEYIKLNPAHTKSLDDRLDVILKPGSLCRSN